MSQDIYVTKPSLPPLEEFLPLLEKIWASKTLTNGAQFHQRLEAELATYLGVGHISLFNNATIALLVALRALNITGEVITTPYSFVATSHSLLWNGLRPVFVDVCPDTFNLNPALVEAAITPETRAIMAVHCYGIPCDVDAIEKIARKHNLKIIYDAAHAMGVQTPSGSLLKHGDLSVLSFHATKVFNTFEGGAIISNTESDKRHIDYLKNFGFSNETTVIEVGINGKMSEFNAALGLVQLGHLDHYIEERRHIAERYLRELGNVQGLELPLGKLTLRGHNYSYFPILVRDAYPLSRDGLYEHLKQHRIFTRRYFYPLISEFPQYAALPSASPDNLPVSSDLAKRILCLPIYPDLTDSELERIITLIKQAGGHDAPPR